MRNRFQLLVKRRRIGEATDLPLLHEGHLIRHETDQNVMPQKPITLFGIGRVACHIQVMEEAAIALEGVDRGITLAARSGAQKRGRNPFGRLQRRHAPSPPVYRHAKQSSHAQLTKG